MKATVLLLLLLVASIAQPAPVGPGKRRSDDRQPLVISQYSKVGFAHRQAKRDPVPVAEALPLPAPPTTDVAVDSAQPAEAVEPETKEAALGENRTPQQDENEPEGEKVAKEAAAVAVDPTDAPAEDEPDRSTAPLGAIAADEAVETTGKTTDGTTEETTEAAVQEEDEGKEEGRGVVADAQPVDDVAERRFQLLPEEFASLAAAFASPTAALQAEDRSFKNSPEEFRPLAADHVRLLTSVVRSPADDEDIHDETMNDMTATDKELESEREERKSDNEKKEKIKSKDKDKFKVRDEEMLRKEALLIKPGKETKPLKKIFSDDPVKEYDDARRRRRRQTTAQGESAQGADDSEGETLSAVPDNWPVVLPNGETSLSDSLLADSADAVIITLIPANYPVISTDGQSSLSDQL